MAQLGVAGKLFQWAELSGNTQLPQLHSIDLLWVDLAANEYWKIPSSLQKIHTRQQKPGSGTSYYLHDPLPPLTPPAPQGGCKWEASEEQFPFMASSSAPQCRGSAQGKVKAWLKDYSFLPKGLTSACSDLRIIYIPESCQKQQRLIAVIPRERPVRSLKRVSGKEFKSAQLKS